MCVCAMRLLILITKRRNNRHKYLHDVEQYINGCMNKNRQQHCTQPQYANDNEREIVHHKWFIRLSVTRRRRQRVEIEIKFICGIHTRSLHHADFPISLWEKRKKSCKAAYAQLILFKIDLNKNQIRQKKRKIAKEKKWNSFFFEIEIDLQSRFFR